jgi:hypothetical protein
LTISTTRFFRDLQVPEVDRLASGAIAAHGLAHVALAGVVRGDRVKPVAIVEVVEVFEVIEGGARRFDNVAAAVIPPVLLEPEARGRARDHLPQAGRAAVRVGKRVVGTLHDGQQGQLQRQAAAHQLVGNVRQVALGACEDALQVVWVAHEPLQFGLDSTVLLRFELESVTQACQQVVGGRFYGLQLVPEAFQRRYELEAGWLLPRVRRHVKAFQGVGRNCRNCQKSDGGGANSAKSLQ